MGSMRARSTPDAAAINGSPIDLDLDVLCLSHKDQHHMATANAGKRTKKNKNR
jgi:hypothetical protein